MDNQEDDAVERGPLLASGAGGVEMQQLPAPAEPSPAPPPSAMAPAPAHSHTKSACCAADAPDSHPLRLAAASSMPADASCCKAEPPLCRICFEEDLTANLEQPCACTGTQKFAHHACIQRWVQEKGHLRCEVCSQEYRGAFEVPPPPPPAPVPTGETIIHPLFGPMLIRVDHDGSAQRASDMYDDQEQYHHRHPGTSWCFSFILFVLFLVLLHHSLIFSDDATDSGVPDSGSVPAPQYPSPDDGSAYTPSFTLFMFWIGSKALMIGIPLYVVLKIAARQAQQEQYEAMLAAGQVVAEPGGRVVLHVRTAQLPHGAREVAMGPNAV